MQEKQQKITACAFLHKAGKLFIAKRADTKKFLPGKYELPGGHIEFGETLEGGLKREFQEEFQVEIEVGEPFYAFTYTAHENTVHSVEVIYFAQLKNNSQEIQLNSEDHSEYRWVTKEEAESLLDPNDAETKAVFIGFQKL